MKKREEIDTEIAKAIRKNAEVISRLATEIVKLRKEVDRLKAEP
jgi:hypothetical protein